MAQFTKRITLNAPTVCNYRTLVWLQQQSTTVNWSKWDAIVTSIADYKHWSKHTSRIVGIVLTDPSELNSQAAFDEFISLQQHIPIILVSHTVFDLHPQQYWSEHVDGVLNLSMIPKWYPYITEPWSDSLEDAIGIFATICRYNRVVDCAVPECRFKSRYEVAHGVVPNQTWLFTQFFRHKNAERFAEIKECLVRNCACPYIDKIVLINEKDYSNDWKRIKSANKVQQVITGTRLTYSDFLKYVADNVPNGVYTILCNADIYFEDSLADLYKINMNDTMLGLLRWDVGTDGSTKLFGPRNDSQDSWIFLSDSIKRRTWDYSKTAFQLGQPGCDNSFTSHMLRQKFLLSNPALTFKSFHLHNTNIRNYSSKDLVVADVYVHLTPTGLVDAKQEIVPSSSPPHNISNEVVPFEIKSSSLSNEITYCTMLEKAGRYKWEPSVENYYFQAAVPIYSWKNAGVTPTGLVYDLYCSYKGHYANDIKFNYWSNQPIDILAPLQKCNRMFAIPFKNTDIFAHPDTYILNYLSRCVRLLTLYPETSFWIPHNFVEYIQYFKSYSPVQFNGIPFDNNTGCWANEVVGFLPGPDNLELASEDIQALRSLLPSWAPTPTNKFCTVVLDTTITREFADEQITKFLLDRDEEWSVRYVRESDYASYDAMIGSSLCIFVGGPKTNTSWSKLWTLPKNCCVIEFQQELHLDGEFQHLAHIAGFKSWVLLLSKGPVNDVQAQIIEQLGKWFTKNGEELC